MKYLRAMILAIAFLEFLFIFLVLFGGCAVAGTPQPTLYSPDEKHIMFIPKGCRIGDIVAPEDGIFIGRSKIIDLQIIEVPVKKKQKKQLM